MSVRTFALLTWSMFFRPASILIGVVLYLSLAAGARAQGADLLAPLHPTLAFGNWSEPDRRLGPAEIADPDLSASEVIRFFDEEVFMNFDNQKYVAKWNGDIAVGIHGTNMRPRMLGYLMNALADVQEATHHNISVVPNNFNFFVILSDDIVKETEANEAMVRKFFPYAGSYEDFMRRFKAENWPCGEKIMMNGTNKELFGYVMMISTSRGMDAFKTCVNQGVIRGIGFEGHLPDSVARWTEDRTAEYKRYLSLLYDPRVKLGARRDQAVTELTNILQK